MNQFKFINSLLSILKIRDVIVVISIISILFIFSQFEHFLILLNHLFQKLKPCLLFVFLVEIDGFSINQFFVSCILVRELFFLLNLFSYFSIFEFLRIMLGLSVQKFGLLFLKYFFFCFSFLFFLLLILFDNISNLLESS